MIFALFAAFSAPLLAVTPTDSPTPSVSPTLTESATCTATPTITATSTPTPGDGSWTFVPSELPLITGHTGVTGIFTYKAGAQAWPSSGGLLTIFFPFGLDAPTTTNFYVAPASGSKAQLPSASGQTYTVQLKNLNPGDSIPFYFGYLAGGLSVTGTSSPLIFQVVANPGSTSPGGGMVTPGASQAILVVQTPNDTATITPTLTQTPTITLTSTITQTPTITLTFTETPIGAEHPNEVYTYPNPYDQKKFEKCTFRFPGDASADVTVFNLVGEPVRQIPAQDINAGQGWAVWWGMDDYLRRVTGGIYFVRVRTPKGQWVKKFTVLY